MVKRWLITGGCGFIGRNLIKSLIVEEGCHIRIIDNLKVGTRQDLAQVCKFEEFEKNSLPFSSLLSIPANIFIAGDILEADLANKVCKDIDIVVHLAANTGVASSVENPRMDCETNVIGTFNYLEAARQNNVKRFIFASSGAPVGEVEPPIHEEVAPHPISPYGASKLAGEGYCSAYFHTFGIETVALRFGNVYGPLSSHKSSVIAKFIRQTLAGEICEIYGDGRQSRDFIYVGDLVEAIRLASSMPSIGGEVFQIATSREHTVNEVAGLLKEMLYDKAAIPMKIFYGSERLGDVRRNYSNTEKATNRLGWTSKTDLKEGLDQTIDWFLNQAPKCY
jgi:UDP-glucose 4-epimerase